MSDISDRVKLLQNLTTMRADLVITSHSPSTRRNRSPIKARRFSETVRRQDVSSGRRTLTRQSASSGSVDRAAKPLRYEPRASPRLGSPTKHPSDSPQLGSPVKYYNESPMSSRLGSPVKSPAKLMHYVLETDEEEEEKRREGERARGGGRNGLIGSNHKRYLSRSMDGLFQVSLFTPYKSKRRFAHAL